MLMKKYLVNTLLVAAVFLLLAVMVVLRTFYPAMNLPALDIPTFCALSLTALVLEYYLVGKQSRCYPVSFLLGAATFGLLPLMAGFACVHTFWKIGLIGGCVFTVTTFVFTSATQRLQTGPKARAAVVLTAIGIYLAAQCFAGILI